MDFEQALRTELITVTGLSNKVFPLNAPEGTAAPYATYESSGLDEDKTLNGFLTTGNLDCTVEVFNLTYGSTKTTANLVKSKIKSFLGRTIGTAGPYIQNVTFEPNTELYEPNVNLYRTIINFKVYF